MGLDVSFHIPRSAPSDCDDDNYEDDDDHCIVDLRGHWLLFDLVAKRGGGRVDDIYDDFYVYPDALDEIEDQLVSEMDHLKLSESLIPRRFETASDLLASQHSPDDNWDELLPAYVRVLRELIRHAEKHGALICAYSA